MKIPSIHNEASSELREDTEKSCLDPRFPRYAGSFDVDVDVDVDVDGDGDGDDCDDDVGDNGQRSIM
jgi:hypothetical protein